MKKDLFEITSDNFAPPYKDYEYFKDCDKLPFRYRSSKFEMINAWWLIEAATLVYADPEFVTEKFKQNAGFQEVEYFSDRVTQCYVATNEKFSIVAFRGSEIQLREGNSDPRFIFADWLANFNFLPERWEQGGYVHRGFKAALIEIWYELEDYISSMQKRNRKIWVTGHSLGAALATLASAKSGNVHGLYTFGSPRVGDQEFKKYFTANSYRFVNNSDIVTKVPPGSMYRHVGELKYIDNKGTIHNDTPRGKKWAGDIQDQFRNMFNAIDQSGKGLTQLLLEPIIDHVPTRYAVHIWNNILQVDG